LAHTRAEAGGQYPTTEIKSRLAPSVIIKTQFNYVNCNETFAVRRAGEIYDGSSSRRASAAEMGERNVEIYGSCLRFVNAIVDCSPRTYDTRTILLARSTRGGEDERYII